MHAQSTDDSDFVSRQFLELNELYWYSGDTFSLRLPNRNGNSTRSQHFRLYGINTPEPDSTRQKELVADTQRFDLSRQQVLEFGEHVRHVVRRTLLEGGTVKTRRQVAEKLGGREYDYAMVYDQRSRDLAVLLLEAGYAVVDDEVARSIADGRKGTADHPLLKAQANAVRAQRGLWALTRQPEPKPEPRPTHSSPSRPDERRGIATPSLGDKTWTMYEEGRFAPQAFAADGDSFAISSSNGRATVWRLYGVDCPETSYQVPSRVQDQAKYFGASEQSVITWGKRAAAYTEQFLANQPVNIYTVHEDARGSGSKKRYYAMIRSSGHDVDLALALVSRGLASAKSKRLPSRSKSALDYHKTLDAAEREAKEQRRGAWGG